MKNRVCKGVLPHDPAADPVVCPGLSEHQGAVRPRSLRADGGRGGYRLQRPAKRRQAVGRLADRQYVDPRRRAEQPLGHGIVAGNAYRVQAVEPAGRPGAPFRPRPLRVCVGAGGRLFHPVSWL